MKETRQMKTAGIIKFISAVLTIIIGVAFFFSINAGVGALSIIIGAELIIAGVLGLIGELIREKQISGQAGVWSAFIIAFGILCIESNLEMHVYWLISYALITVGVVYLIDAFLAFFVRKEPFLMFIIGAAIGVLALVVGICLRTVNGFADFCSVVIGIILVIYGVYNLVVSLFVIGVLWSKDGDENITLVKTEDAEDGAADVKVEDVKEE